MLRWLFKKLFYRERKRLLDTLANREAVIRRHKETNRVLIERLNGVFRENKNLVHALELLRQADNYKAAIQLLNIREEQIGEFLSENAAEQKRALDGAKASRKSKRSTGSPRK